ncbi:hypothetical protein NKH77_11925 [Streptomyces sp. M19]
MRAARRRGRRRLRVPALGDPAGVLDNLDPAQRRLLHHRAATLLYADGAPPAAIAPHLLAAESFDEPWSVPVLQDAAEEVLADDDTRTAIGYLELAHRFCADPQQRVEIRIRTAVIVRRCNPSMAENLANELLSALRAGRMPRSTTPRWPSCSSGTAGSTRRRRSWRRCGSAPPTPTSAPPRCPSRWCASRSRTTRGPPGAPSDASTAWTPPRPCPAAREEDHPAGPPWGPPAPSAVNKDEVAAAAEEMLRRSVLTDLTLEPICATIKCLLAQGRTDRALYWCELFLKETVRRDTGGWFAMFAELRAEIALQQGDLREAEEYTHAALRRLPERKGSVLAGGLIGLQVLAQTARGNYEAGARTLNQPASEALFGSGYGLVYLRARGYYHLATNRLDVALEDFLSVGRMAQNWQLDQPSWVPWRGEVAEVLLELGERAEAQRLIGEQLARGEGGNARIRGISCGC